MTDLVPHDLCWSCQEEHFCELTEPHDGSIPSGKDVGFVDGRVWIDTHVALPVCRACWLEMEVADRVALALKFAESTVDELRPIVERYIKGLSGNTPSEN